MVSRTSLISRRIAVVAAALGILFGAAFHNAEASSYQFIRATEPGGLTAIDPDLAIRRIDPRLDRNSWLLAKQNGVPPIYYRTRVPGLFDRIDFFSPLGFKEESTFQTKLRFFPFFESRWSKLPPYDGFSRALTVFQGRSDLGQEYGGVFPFYGYTYRRFGLDYNSFFMFPLYYRSHDDDAVTHKILYPLITYADSPGRKAAKFWPFIGVDRIRNEYDAKFLLWPLFQSVEKHCGTDQFKSFKALPFPLLVIENDKYQYQVNILWPFVNYYHHYATGHTRFSLYPLFSYGYGGGIDEFSFLFYSYKRDARTGITKTTGDGYIAVEGDEVETEQRFLYLGRIKKRYRKGWLASARYRFWPFAEYSWDADKGTTLKFPDLIPANWEWWDTGIGKRLRFLDFRETPITRELSMLFGFSRRAELKTVPGIPKPPRPGDDGWNELVLGAFGKQ